MTTTFHLVRHGSHDRLDRVLCGRMAGVTLGEEGREQAQKIAARLSTPSGGQSLAAVYASPLERTRETAEPIAQASGAPLQVLDALTEIDVGDWSGRTWDELRPDPAWALWNTQRSLARPPGGESMLEVQARVMGAMADLRARHPDAAVAVVSHSDVVKLIVAYHLGLPIDAHGRIEIGPASLSTLVVGDWGARLQTLNDVSHLS